MTNKLTSNLTRKFNLLVIVILIIALVTPTVAVAAPALSNLPQSSPAVASAASLPEIAPYRIGDTGMWTPNIWDAASYEWEHHGNNDLAEPDPALVARIQDQKAMYWMQCPYIQDAFRFYELRHSAVPFSNLPASDRELVFRQMGIPEADYGEIVRLFMMLEQNGHSLGKSIYLIVIMSGGLFSYPQARTLTANIPCMVERNTEIMRFERLIRSFDMPHYLRTRQIMVSSVVSEHELHAYTQTNAQRFLFSDELATPGALGLPNDFIYDLIDTGRLDAIARTGVSPRTFTSETAFYVAKQMFLEGRGVAEIEAAFAIGAALRVEPVFFLLPPGLYRARSGAGFGVFSTGDSMMGGMAESHAWDGTLASLNADAPPPPPSMPVPVRAVMDMPSPIDHPFDVNMVMGLAGANIDEIDNLVDYGKDIMGFSIAPLSEAPIHGEIIRDPFTLNFNANESVCLSSGAARYRINVLSLPIHGGSNFSLGL